VLLAGPSCAFALDPALDVSQYAHTAWKVRDGFTRGQIQAIAQTPDGYLWLGTEFGLVRFDGVRAVPWQPPAGQHLPSTNIRRLTAARDGTLWIGTSNGLVSWKDGKLTQYTELAGRLISALVEDHEGTVWASGFGQPFGKLCAIRNSRVQCYGEDGTLGLGATNLYEDRKGNLWAGVMTGLWRWSPGPGKFYPLAGQVGAINGFAEDADGTLLIGWKKGVWRFADGKTTEYTPRRALRQSQASRLLRDHNGGLWIGTRSEGLVHVHQGRTDVFSLRDGLTGEIIIALLEDREGSTWVVTANGLDRFRELAVPMLTVSQGLPNGFPLSVLAGRDGSVWLGTDRGLYVWRNGQTSTYDKREGKLNGLSPNALFQDDRGRIWVSTISQFGYLDNDRFVPVNTVTNDAVRGIAVDTAGNLWVAYLYAGLFQLSQGSVVRKIPWASIGHKDGATALVADPKQGGLWIGFVNGGITYYRDGQVRASYTAADGLGEGWVTDVRFDRDGALWAATQGGLSRLKNGRIATLTSKNGLPCDAVHWVMEDDPESIWLNMPCGLVRIARPGIDSWTAAADRNNDATRPVQTMVFDSSDGVRISASRYGYTPVVAKSRDGKLWFANYDGFAVLDPNHLPVNKLPPPVHIEQIAADHNVYWQNSSGDASASVHLPAQVRDLEINYTALSFVAPEKVFFRYKLEGWDSDWQWVGNRRQAFYTNLSPGDYRFRVAASNNSGVWNEAGTSFAFSIAPAYYQTTWFRLSCVAAFLALLWVLYQRRLRQATQRVQHRFEGRLMERERIARELHDTLLQSVQGLILKFDAVAKQIPRDEPARRAMDEALDRADQVMGEGRDSVRNLRAGGSALNDLPAAFQRVAEETATGREATFKTIVEGGVRDLNPMVLEECYSIGREALINALAHSGGLHVEVEIMYDPRQFRLRVRDDGRGVDPTILEKGGRPGHWGMQGMRERAQGIGAQLGLWSRPGSGTEVELLVPAATAYKSRRAPTRTSWLGRVSSNGR
jgi:ligand-binding sensor domain-containing protein/signal transduction histidine kinase